VFDPAIDKQISGFDIPQELIISFSYSTPKLAAESGGMKAVSWFGARLDRQRAAAIPERRVAPDPGFQQ